MKATKKDISTLKEILQNIRTPEKLDDHPWVKKRVVKDFASKNEAVAAQSAGNQLIFALGELFKELQPPISPRHGKRLDTAWGRFGILAANYFAPLLYGRVHPRTLRDAWWRIDESILVFVYGADYEEKTKEEIEKYALLGDQAEFAANSTISDWHRKGIQELADIFMNNEERLRLSLITENLDTEKRTPSKARKNIWRWIWLSLFSLFLIVAFSLISIGIRVYDSASLLQEDVRALQGLDYKNIEQKNIEEAGEVLKRTTVHIENLQAEVEPWFWLSNKLGWVPRYGGDLAYADEMLLMASELLESAEYAYSAGAEFLTLLRDDSQDIEAYEITKLLLAKESDFLLAKNASDRAGIARRSIDEDKLSTQSRKIITQVDQYLPLLDDTLTLSLSLPDLLGATSSGPKTYLILIQNEDELRPTGGFLTSVAKVVIRNGELVSLDIQDSYDVDADYDEELYPISPWQLYDYMNLQVMTFRDSNWFTDFPTTVTWAEYLYAKKYAHSVDGVIAINQHVLVKLLDVTGRIFIPTVGRSVSSENILDVMRAQKEPPSAEERDPDWHRKQFMQPISSAILQKLLDGDEIPWEALTKAMLSELDQHHILVQLDNPVLAELLVSRGWDGAIRNESGDFLMVVDTNVGYNKTNAVVSRSLVYDVDLTDISSPSSNLVVIHKNDAQGENGEDGKCDQKLADPTIPWYPINRCYYNYLRVYAPAESVLTGASPHAVTREEMVMLYENIPARVDLLNEKIDNIQAYGTLLVVPMGESLQTGFEFALPPNILQPKDNSKELLYHLVIRKQSGIESMPVTLRIHLPKGAKVISTSEEGIEDTNNLFFELILREDIVFEIAFKP